MEHLPVVQPEGTGSRPVEAAEAQRRFFSKHTESFRSIDTASVSVHGHLPKEETRSNLGVVKTLYRSS
jgi:hypothetical protein